MVGLNYASDVCFSEREHIWVDEHMVKEYYQVVAFFVLSIFTVGKVKGAEEKAKAGP